MVEESIFGRTKEKMEEIDYQPPKFSDLSLTSHD